MTLPFSIDRLPAELGQAVQQVADAAGLVIARRAVVVDAIDEFLVLGADAPALGRLLAVREDGQQVVAAFDQPVRLRAYRRCVGSFGAALSRALEGRASISDLWLR